VNVMLTTVAHGGRHRYVADPPARGRPADPGTGGLHPHRGDLNGPCSTQGPQSCPALVRGIALQSQLTPRGETVRDASFAAFARTAGPTASRGRPIAEADSTVRHVRRVARPRLVCLKDRVFECRRPELECKDARSRGPLERAQGRAGTGAVTGDAEVRQRAIGAPRTRRRSDDEVNPLAGGVSA
jgi:hypothetical protein